MAISLDINDREHGKFLDLGGKPVVRVTLIDGSGNQIVDIATQTTLQSILTTLATQATLQDIFTTLGATNASPEAYTTADWLKQIKAAVDSQLSILNFISDGTPTSLGQGTMAESQKVVIASDQTAVPVSSPTYLTKIDEADANTTYVGDAVIGTASSSALWRIKKLSVSSTVTTIAWAAGASSFNQIWDNRASLSYS